MMQDMTYEISENSINLVLCNWSKLRIYRFKLHTENWNRTWLSSGASCTWAIDSVNYLCHGLLRWRTLLLVRRETGRWSMTFFMYRTGSSLTAFRLDTVKNVLNVIIHKNMHCMQSFSNFFSMYSIPCRFWWKFTFITFCTVCITCLIVTVVCIGYIFYFAINIHHSLLFVGQGRFLQYACSGDFGEWFLPSIPTLCAEQVQNTSMFSI